MKYFWDASALVKRYCSEKGTEQVNSLFEVVSSSDFIIADVSILEVISVLTRKRNDGRITQEEFVQAMVEFGSEIVSNSEIATLELRVQPLTRCTNIVITHGLNSVDAILLKTATEQQSSVTLVTTDLRLFNAAIRERIPVINPELIPLADLRERLKSNEEKPEQQKTKESQSDL